MKSSLRRLPNKKSFHSSTLRGEGVSLSFVGSGWMEDKLYYEPRELEYLEYKDYAVHEYEHLMKSMDSHSVTTMDAARNLGVKREWDVYHLFADLDAPRDNPGNLDLASSPDNILLATKEGHREHLHGGDTHNPTAPEYLSEGAMMRRTAEMSFFIFSQRKLIEQPTEDFAVMFLRLYRLKK